MIERLKRSKPPKCIRTYKRIASKEHRCFMCDEPINPGDEYKGEIFVGKTDGRKYFMVYKIHEFCPGQRHDDEDEEEQRTRDAIEETELKIAEAA